MELALMAVFLFLYFLPGIVGLHKRNAMAIFALDLLLGWTVMGWLVALIWALTKDPQQSQIAPHGPRKETQTIILPL